MPTKPFEDPAAGLADPAHRRWLADQAEALFAFFQPAAINPAGGFYDLDDAGRPVADSLRQIHATCRMVHCYVLARLMGRPGADTMIDHGMEFLWTGHRDRQHGGYFWSLDADGPKDDSKQAYGHAFVLLAASSAKAVGHPLADKVLADISTVLQERFWEKQHGAVAEEFSRDWTPLSAYRGQNANMHLTEALMGAFEATGEKTYLDKAESIADLIIRRIAGGLGYRVAEHFHENWTLDESYSGGDVFRPFGTTPGHWLEWSRLLLQLWVLGGRRLAWLPEAARALFAQATRIGWDADKGGFFYALDWDDRPVLRQKLWWPCSEGIGAAAFLCAHDPSPEHAEWYGRIWEFTAAHFIDAQQGGWFPELGEDLKPAQTLFSGKSDIYHAVQACLIPLYPAEGSLVKVMAEAQGRPRIPA